MALGTVLGRPTPHREDYDRGIAARTPRNLTNMARTISLRAMGGQPHDQELLFEQ